MKKEKPPRGNGTEKTQRSVFLMENNKSITQNRKKYKEKLEEKKRMSQNIAKKMFKLALSKFNTLDKNDIIKRGFNIKNCSDFVLMGTCEHCGKTRVLNASLCRDRICPTCQWRLAMKRAGEMVLVLQEICNNYDLWFLTLTQKNCKPNELKTEIEKINKAWDRTTARLRKNKKYDGYARVLEITYNKKNKTFHPHLHVILASSGNNNLDTREWERWWMQSLRIAYIPQINIQKIQSDGNKKKISKSALETFKYTTKYNDIDNMGMREFSEYLRGIKGKNFVTYSGIFKEERKRMKLNDEIEDLSALDKCSECNSQLLKYALHWSANLDKYEEYFKKDDIKIVEKMLEKC